MGARNAPDAVAVLRRAARSRVFRLVRAGQRRVNDTGHAAFTPAARRYLILSNQQRARTLEALVMLASQPR